MNYMNGRTRKKFYELLTERDGEYCNFCRIPVTEKQLVVDHRDNNNTNNEINNLQLLCRRCNYIRNSRESGDTCERHIKETKIQINRKKNRSLENMYMTKLAKKDA